MPVQTPLPTKYLKNNETDSAQYREQSGNSEPYHCRSIASHTPGPWEIRFSRQGYPYEITAPHDRHVKGGVGSPVRWAGIGCPSSPAALANARLIAAAPELLAAIKGIMADTCDLEPAYCADLVPETRDLIRAAIAKATGTRVTDDPITGTAST